VQARSNVGTVRFGSSDIQGALEVVRSGEGVDVQLRPSARLELPLASLTSGNALYDAELQQRLAVRRHPVATVELLEAELLSGADYRVTGTVTIHGVTATLHGEVRLTFREPGQLLVSGEKVVDIRDFDLELPNVLMLRIYPDVKVRLQLVARETDQDQELS
jgi:polyisoprenoid-binding protein YceI